jgi:hypothetical protein
MPHTEMKPRFDPHHSPHINLHQKFARIWINPQRQEAEQECPGPGTGARKGIQQSPAGGGPKSRRQRFGEARNRITAKAKLIKNPKGPPPFCRSPHFVVAQKNKIKQELSGKINPRRDDQAAETSVFRCSGSDAQYLDNPPRDTSTPRARRRRPALGPAAFASSLFSLSVTNTPRRSQESDADRAEQRSLCVEEREDSGTAGAPTARERRLRVAERDGKAWERGDSWLFGSPCGGSGVERLLRTARNADLFSLKVGRETDRDELRLAFFY